MKRLALVLTMSFLVPSVVSAGEVPSVVPAPPPTVTQTSSGDIPSVPGEVPTVGAADQISSDAWSALLSVLAFLGV
jgi:hypothetical protein